MIQVNIISGFLGAGKTTLIKKLVSEALKEQKVILLENEYGEVGIDGGFMKDSGIQITELNSGCICCTLAGDFTKAIDEIVEKYKPDRLIVEPTGVGKLSDIRRIVEDCEKSHGLSVSGCATVVDAGKCKMYLKNFGEFFIDQVKSAETIIFSRTQLVSQEKLEQSIALIKEQNPTARIITTPWDELDASTILHTIETPDALLDMNTLFPKDESEEEEHHHHHHEEEEAHEHHHHHDDDDDDDDDDHECCHHHHDDDDDDDDHDHEHEHEHHHDENGHCSCGHHHHHHHHGEHDADEVFQNLGVETVHKFDEKELRAALEQLGNEEKYGSVLRAKGIVPAADGRWIHFDYVPEEIDIRYGSADYTGRLCVIGAGLKEDAVRTLFGL